MLDAPERVGVRLQPIVDLRGATARGYAAVVRIPGGSGRTAREWFDDAALAGHAGILEAQVVQAALVARPLLARGRFLAVGLSDAALVSEPVRLAFAAETALDHVVVEVDGAARLGQDVAAAVAVLRGMGARIAVDLTRGGSIARVANLSPEYVRAPVVDATTLDDLFSALADLGLDQDPWLIADGVEDDTKLETVRAGGVRFAQGDGLAPALPAPTELAPSARRRLLAGTPHDLGGLAQPGLSLVSSLALPAATTLRDAARAAMARPVAERFDPIAVLGPDGTRAGVVPIDRLVSALAG